MIRYLTGRIPGDSTVLLLGPVYSLVGAVYLLFTTTSTYLCWYCPHYHVGIRLFQYVQLILRYRFGDFAHLTFTTTRTPAATAPPSTPVYLFAHTCVT